MVEVDKRVKDPASLIGMIAKFMFDDVGVFHQLTIKLHIVEMLRFIQPQSMHVTQVHQAILSWWHRGAMGVASVVEVGLERLCAKAPVDPQSTQASIGLCIKAIVVYILQDSDHNTLDCGSWDGRRRWWQKQRTRLHQRTVSSTTHSKAGRCRTQHNQKGQ